MLSGFPVIMPLINTLAKYVSGKLLITSLTGFNLTICPSSAIKSLPIVISTPSPSSNKTPDGNEELILLGLTKLTTVDPSTVSKASLIIVGAFAGPFLITVTCSSLTKPLSTPLTKSLV